MSTSILLFCPQTFLALGKGTWIVPRLFRGGTPLDYNFSRSMVWSTDPEFDFNELVMREACGKMDHFGSGVGCKENPASSPVSISDDLPVGREVENKEFLVYIYLYIYI